MTWVVVVQLLFGGQIVTLETQFDNAYGCYLEEYLVKAGTSDLHTFLAEGGLTEYEVIPRCYEIAVTPKKARP